jgi:hypothetical protein
LTELLPCICSIRSYTVKFGVIPRKHSEDKDKEDPELYFDVHQLAYLGSSNEASMDIFQEAASHSSLWAWQRELKQSYDRQRQKEANQVIYDAVWEEFEADLPNGWFKELEDMKLSIGKLLCSFQT